MTTSVLTSGHKSLKYLLHFFNFLYFVVGCGFLKLGVSALKFYIEGNYRHDDFYPLVVIVTVLGAVITAITLSRVYFIASEKLCLLKGIFILMLVMFISEIVFEICHIAVLSNLGQFLTQNRLAMYVIYGLILLQTLDLIISMAFICVIGREKRVAGCVLLVIGAMHLRYRHYEISVNVVTTSTVILITLFRAYAIATENLRLLNGIFTLMIFMIVLEVILELNDMVCSGFLYKGSWYPYGDPFGIVVFLGFLLLQGLDLTISMAFVFSIRKEDTTLYKNIGM